MLSSKDDSLNLLNSGVMPERYLRNSGTIGVIGQKRLLNSSVAVVGAGGLGGLVIELLARMGVGHIKAIDGDVFAKHNLNRQVLATENNMLQKKVDVAQLRVKEVNSDVFLEPVAEMLNGSNAKDLLCGMCVVVDALDNFTSRIILCQAAKECKIPVVHAAIAGFTGQVMTVMPEDKSFERILKNISDKKGAESSLGNPSATPALAASLQSQEVMKILTGMGKVLRNKMLYFDTEYNIFEMYDIVE